MGSCSVGNLDVELKHVKKLCIAYRLRHWFVCFYRSLLYGLCINDYMNRVSVKLSEVDISSICLN